MPFFIRTIKPNKIIIKNKNNNKCASLQVQKHKFYNLSGKRVFLFALHNVNNSCNIKSSNNLRGSLTIEAALAMSVFLYASFAMIHFILMFNWQVSMQMNINNIAKDTAKKMYYLEIANNITNNDKNGEETRKSINSKFKEYENKNADADNDEIGQDNNKFCQENVIGVAYLYGKLVKEIGVKNSAQKLVDLSKSKVDMNDGLVDIIAISRYKYPYFSNDNQIQIVQRARMKAWTGRDLTQQLNLVYMTDGEKVYHTNIDCTYLNLNIEKTSYLEMTQRRTGSGSKYKACSICVNKKIADSQVVFITKEGKKYHTDINCRGLTRRVITLDISQVETKNACSKCGATE